MVMMVIVLGVVLFVGEGKGDGDSVVNGAVREGEGGVMGMMVIVLGVVLFVGEGNGDDGGNVVNGAVGVMLLMVPLGGWGRGDGDDGGSVGSGAVGGGVREGGWGWWW